MVFLLLAMSGCNMDETPYSTNEDAILKDPNGADILITNVYNTFWSSSLMKKSYMECIDMDHDHSAAPSWVVSGAGDGNITTHWSYNTSQDPFLAFYKVINRANYALETIPHTVSDPTKKQQYIGEAHFLRAFSYFHLVRMYGKLPIRLNSRDLGDKARSSVADVYGQIISDLKDACNAMDWATSGAKWGHANKTAAKILMAKVYATMASGALAGTVDMDVNIKGANRSFKTKAVAGYDEFDATECYGEVIKICNEMILRRGTDYDMMTTFNKIWGADNARNKEFVWGITGNSQLEYTTEHLGYYYTAPTYYGRGWAGITTHAYGLYEETDLRGEHGIFHYVKQTYDNTGAYVRVPNNPDKYPTGPDGKPSRGVDNYYYTIFITKWYTGAGTVDSPTPNITAPGYALKAQDIPMIRFAELYLLRAEALNELDDNIGALADLKTIRDRMNASDLTSSSLSKEQLRSVILNERAMEFMQEFNRKFDLLRWGLYLDVMNATVSVQIQGGSTISKVREEKSLLYAVPLNEILNNKLFGRNNNGW